MSNLVRVKDPSTGHEYTTSRTDAENSGLRILEKKAAVDQSGRPLPAKPNVGPKPRAVKNDGPEAATQEEN